ncbi:kinase-like domain-containing protein [Boeremia exigua]|uniref:kinase-like domain-containing protein n=1 Tax=Boeremia exigua TaxID=749465 RepID=UPI001E8CB17F|nr:kinase-like domain-containing protein [Boeremia exigua]KAH6629807.1 kinase-like domain-containing protein [Boeremia exigua]
MLGRFTYCAKIGKLLRKAKHPVEWSDNPKLYYLLWKIGQVNLFAKLLKQGITDLWIPFTKKTLQVVLGKENAKRFSTFQEACLDDEFLYDEDPLQLPGRHLSLDDAESLRLEELKELGKGGLAIVWSVRYKTGALYARKTMQRMKKSDSNLERMQNFKRELEGMRRAQHRHCIKLVASYTDTESVSMLLYPVADMDLTEFLNGDSMSAPQMAILRHSVGCITSALVYLHEKKIRHDDMKPNNILVHGSNILLTDFGFCRDTTDSAASTTYGRPIHNALRYSAPEVFEQDPRSRLTDIWGLGCVLFEIVSRLRGHTLNRVEKFYQINGSCINSFANNHEATKLWCHKIASNQTKTQHGIQRRELLLMSYVCQMLLEAERSMRPTAAQVFDKLKDMDFVYPAGSDCWVDDCCVRQSPYAPDVADYENFRSQSSVPGRDPYFAYDLPQWPLLDLAGLDGHLAYLLLDMDLAIRSHSDDLNYLLSEGISADLSRLLVSEKDTIVLQNDVQAMLRLINLPKHVHGDVHYDKIDYAVILKSLQFARIQQTASTVRSFNLFQPKQALPRCYTTQLTLTTFSMSGHQANGTPFLVLTFDPSEGELVGYSYSEGSGGVWTDGLIGSAFGESEKEQRPVRWKNITEQRKKDHLQATNRLRAVRKGFEHSKCVRCKIHGYECSGPAHGACGACRHANEKCRYDPRDIESGGENQRYIENERHVESMIAARWAS